MKMLGLFLIRCVFTKKLKAQKLDSENLLKPEPERMEAFRNTVASRAAIISGLKS